MKWIVYILQMNDGSYYTGITNNLDKRLEAHRSGKGSKYVGSRLPCSVIYISNEPNRSEASKHEARIKKLSKKEKELLIKEKDMTFPVKPLYDQVFVRKEDSSKTKSGIHLTDSVKGRAVIGVVVAAGPGLLSPFTGGFLPMTVKEGDRVYIKEFSGYIIKYEGEEDVHVFKENEIVGVIPGE